MKKIIIYYNFIIVAFVVVAGFLSATSLAQLITAILFFPLLIYFAARVIPRRAITIPIPKEDKLVLEKVVKLKEESVDVNRRMFLKLIGSAGLAIFVFSIFTKRFEPAFFKSAPGVETVSLKDSAGNKIDPAEKQPTDGYRISELDNSDVTYYGFTRKDGAWFIMREDEAGSFRYIKGPSSFSASWTNRVSLTYDYYNEVF